MRQAPRLVTYLSMQEEECDKRYGWFSAADFQTMTQQIHAKFLGPSPCPLLRRVGATARLGAVRCGGRCTASLSCLLHH